MTNRQNLLIFAPQKLRDLQPERQKNASYSLVPRHRYDTGGPAMIA